MALGKLLSIVSFIAVLAAVSLVACSRKPGKVSSMLPMEAMGMLRNDFAVLIDVREPEEQKGGIAEPAISMPTSKIQSNHPDWQKLVSGLPKGKKIIFYCAVGGRAGQAAELLATQGFDTGNIGGYDDWVKAGLPTRKP